MTIRFSSDPSFQKWLSPGVIVCRVCDCSGMIISRVFVARDDCSGLIVSRVFISRDDYSGMIISRVFISRDDCSGMIISRVFISRDDCSGMIISREFISRGDCSGMIISRVFISRDDCSGMIDSRVNGDGIFSHDTSFLYCTLLFDEENHIAGNGFILLNQVYTKQSLHSCLCWCLLW